MLDALQSTSSVRLLQKAVSHPLLAVNRLLQAARFARLRETEERDASVRFLSTAFETDVRSILDKHKRSEMGSWMRRRSAKLKSFPGPYRLGATPQFDCETIYLLVRSRASPRSWWRPALCYGASSAYILQALKDNGAGSSIASISATSPTSRPATISYRDSSGTVGT
jgi:hypothetical protein